MIESALATIERETERLTLQEQLKLLESLVRQIRKKSNPVGNNLIGENFTGLVRACGTERMHRIM